MRQLFALFLLSAILFFVDAYSANDTECLDNVKELAKCLKEKDDKEDTEKKLSKVQTRISKCFADNKCDEPDLGAEPFQNETGFLKTIVTHAKQAFDDVPEKIKTCFKESIGKLVLDKVNQCLKKKKVDELKVDEHDLFETFKQFAPSNESTEDDKLLKGAINIFHGLVLCHKKEGADASNATLQCMEPIKDDIKEEICDRLKPCIKDKLSDSCRKRGKEIETALCDCQLDQLKSIDEKIEKLDDGKDYKVPDLAKNAASSDFKQDWDEFIDHISKCYNESKADPPKSLEELAGALILHGIHPLGRRGVLPFLIFSISSVVKEGTVTSEQIKFFHNVVHDMIEHHECGCNDK
jgi:hypothetical protein